MEFRISGNILQLIKNFLKDRKQHVVLNGKSSKWESISAGVPQGSVLDPLFFLIYINDIISNVTCGIRLYADDTSLFSVVDDENITARAFNRDREKINLSRGSGKCILMLIKRMKLSFLGKGNNRTIQTSAWEMMQ